MDIVEQFREALNIITKYAPDARLIAEEEYFLVNVGNAVPTDSDLRRLRTLGWNYEDKQIYKMR